MTTDKANQAAPGSFDWYNPGAVLLFSCGSFTSKQFSNMLQSLPNQLLTASMAYLTG